MKWIVSRFDEQTQKWVPLDHEPTEDFLGAMMDLIDLARDGLARLETQGHNFEHNKGTFY